LLRDSTSLEGLYALAKALRFTELGPRRHPDGILLDATLDGSGVRQKNHGNSE
jgi:hypothetical protein